MYSMYHGKALSLSVLALAGLSFTSCAKHPAASFEVVQAPPPHIDSVAHGAPEGAHPGDTVSLTMKGDAGMTASASLGALVPSVPLSEDASEKGLYRGTVRLPEGKTGTFDLTGKLAADESRVSTLPGPPLRVLTAPAAPSPKHVATAADFNAQKVLGTIHFDFNRADLRDDSRTSLASSLEWLQAHAAFRVLIEGHCDERGTNEYNMSLGDRRANAAKEYLLKAGIDASRLRTISYGEERPIDPGHNEAAWAANRRAEFILED